MPNANPRSNRFQEASLDEGKTESAELVEKRVRCRPITVSIVEDEPWLREDLALQIGRSPGLRFIKSYASAETALSGILLDRPDVVIMDINLPGLDGVECVRRLKSVLPETQFLMLTVYEESDKIFNSMLAGASGYLLKRSDSTELLEAIHHVWEGGSPISSSVARQMVHYFNQMGSVSELTRLSPREYQVLALLAKGSAYKEIATQLSLTVETIRMNVKHIYSKLHVHSRGEAAAKFATANPGDNASKPYNLTLLNSSKVK